MSQINHFTRALNNRYSKTNLRKTIGLPTVLLGAFIFLTLSMKGSAAPAGLVAAYNFDELSGISLIDSSGSGNNGTISGATRSPSGKFGSALSFNAATRNNFVSIPHSPSLLLSSGMTLEAWVNPNTLGTNGSSWRTAVLKERPGNMAYALYANNGAARPAGQVSINGEQNAIGTSQLALNTWTHLATTYDGSTLRLYINGNQVGSKPQTGNIISSTGLLKIGGNAIWGEWFGGRIDDVRVYNRALSAAELSSDMNTPVGVSDTQAPTAPTNLSQTGSTESSVSLGWTASTDNITVADYTLYNSLVPVGVSTSTNGTISGLSCGITYSVGVDARDTSNNRSSITQISATTSACDTTPPNVQIAAPAAGSTVGGTVTVQADASDNRSVVGVQFKLNGANLGSEDTSAPYAISWDTTISANGLYSLTAVARDGSSNQTTSSSVSVRVFNLVPNFTNETLITGLNEPTEMIFTPDGRMWIGERTGKIKIVQPGASQVDAIPLIDIPNIYNATDERGILGMTLDPSFSTNGYFYVHYTHSTLKNRVSRFTAVGNTVNPSSEVVIWANDLDSAIYHSGGTIAFGPDGYMYIGVGDRLDPLSAQRLDTFSGKILRIGRDGTVPTDNPFYDGTGPNKDAIWAYGLRNPFRFSFDSVSGRMYIGDVGQNTTEEIDLGVRGANYGWPTCEGPCGRAGLTDPIHSYDNTNGAAAIGGFVYRGTQFPAEYQGSYFYADYVNSWIKRLTFDASGNVTGNLNFEPADGSSYGPYGNPVSLVQGPEGSLYYVDIGPFQNPNTGTIRRIRNTTANQPPVIELQATPKNGSAPLAVTFSSAGTFDPEGQPLTYSWDFGDNTSSNDPNTTHTYTQDGPYVARLSVSDGISTTVSDPQNISVGNAPQPVISAPSNNSTFRAGQVLSFSGNATDSEDGALAPGSLSWRVTFLHESHQHPASSTIVGSSGTYPVPISGHDFTGNTRYEISLTATDSSGLSTTTSIIVLPEKVNITLGSNPSVGQVVVDGLTHTTPYTFDSLVGFEHLIDAVSPQAISGVRYRFLSWSDGGAKTHNISVPATNQTYTANLEIDPSNPGLVAAFNFNEANGGTLYDLSGSNNNGTVSGAAWTGSGKYGGGLLFDGVNDMVTVNDANALDFTNTFTLEAWVNPTVNGNWSTVIFKERPGGMLYSLYTNNGTTRPVGQVFLSNNEQDAIGTAAIPLNTWTHLASTYDGTTLRLYVNGTQVATKAITGSLANTASPLRLGGNSIWGEWFNGQIDNVRIYNRSLPVAEIQADMNTPVN